MAVASGSSSGSAAHSARSSYARFRLVVVAIAGFRAPGDGIGVIGQFCPAKPT
jgi:hypothetical protein